MPIASEFYGRLADETQVQVEIYSSYRLNYSYFTTFNINAMLLYHQKCLSVGFSQVELFIRCVLRHVRFGCYFFMSILTSKHYRT